MAIFTKIYKSNKKQALKDIIKKYKENWFWVVNYLYFANLVSSGIIGKKKVNTSFLRALEKGDFLLPDGIALQMYYKKYFKMNLENLNGTDFAEYILKNLKTDEYNLILYGAKKEVIKKACQNIEEKYGIQVAYFQDGYSEFDFEKLDELWKDFYFYWENWKLVWIQRLNEIQSGWVFEGYEVNNKNSFLKQKINIFMVWLWTPKQEIWIQENIENIKKYHLLAFSQGWTFDFWAGNEKRAPQVFIKWKLEWFWRFITNPRKNFKKVWYSLYLFYYLYGKGK